MRSKTSLGSSREVAQGCGVSFVNYLYLVPLIIDQNFYTTCATTNQTGPRAPLLTCCARGAWIFTGSLCNFFSTTIYIHYMHDTPPTSLLSTLFDDLLVKTYRYMLFQPQVRSICDFGCV